MITIEKMSKFFRYDKVKYRNPVKFPEIAEEMVQCKTGIYKVNGSVL